MNEKIIDEILKKDIKINETDIVSKRIYRIHKYWARKPASAIEDLILRYSNENDYVLDPYMGSGVMGLESVINSRNFIGSDLNPIAVEISKETMNFFYNSEIMKKEVDDLKSRLLKSESELFQAPGTCSNCGHILYYKHFYSGPKYQENAARIYCKNCNKSNNDIIIEDLEYQRLKKQIDKMKIPYWVPKNEFPEKFYKDRFSYKGVSKVTDLYSKRNLISLSIILNTIKENDYVSKKLFLIAFSNTVLHSSKLKGENVRPLGVNNYWIPDDYIYENPFFRFEERLNVVRNSKKSLKEREFKYGKKLGQKYLSIRSSLSPYPENSVDYVITDPPYGDAIQYSELSYVWNSWMKETYEIEDEVITNPQQDKNESSFIEMLLESIDNIYHALKDKKYFTICFQSKNYTTWENIINHCKKIGFDLVDVNIYHTLGSSFTQNWAKFSPKNDIYVTFKKTKSVDKSKSFLDTENSLENIIKSFINKAKDNNLSFEIEKIYDYVITYLIYDIYYNEHQTELIFTIEDVITLYEKYGKYYNEN